MSKPTRPVEPDPMTRVVDRLLAQLPGLRGDPIASVASRSTTAPRRGVVVGTARDADLSEPLAPAELVALWGRTLLALVLGAFMTQWPYAHACGWALLGYVAAVGVVIVAGAWVALASWKLHHGLAHILALMLVFWGIVLAAEQVLPRTGYAADRATWWCGDEFVARWAGGSGGR
jgi:hypothetical protein